MSEAGKCYARRVWFIFSIGKKPSRPPPPQSKTEEVPQQPVDSGSSGEDSDDEQEQDQVPGEVETKVRC